MKLRKTLEKVLSGSLDLSFCDFRRLIEAFGFRLSRISGSHHIFSHPNVIELVNIQEVHGKSKPYQVRQFLKLVEEYSLSLDEDAK